MPWPLFSRHWETCLSCINSERLSSRPLYLGFGVCIFWSVCLMKNLWKTVYEDDRRQKMMPCICPWLEVIWEPTGLLLWFHNKRQKLILVCVRVRVFLCPSPIIPLPSSSARGSVEMSVSAAVVQTCLCRRPRNCSQLSDARTRLPAAASASAEQTSRQHKHPLPTRWIYTLLL